MRIPLPHLVILLFVSTPLAAQMHKNAPLGNQQIRDCQRLLAYEESSSGLETPQLHTGRMGLEMGDVNGDGFVDLVSIGDHGSPSNEHGIMVWFGNGTAAGWIHFMNGDFGYGDVALGDLNNDGLMDVGYGMHHDYSATDFGDQLIETVLGDGTGMNWTPWDDGLAEDGQSWGMFGTDLADVDADGDLDLVSVSFGAGDGLHVYLNNNDGTWTRSFGFLGGNSTSEVLFGDINNDGCPDIVAGHQTGAFWLGDGKGGFVKTDVPPGGPGSRADLRGFDLGDLNSDGCQDLSFCTSVGSVLVWLWNGAGGWSSLSQGLPYTGFDKTQLCDMDSDGRLDLVSAGEGRVTVWKLDQASVWREAASFQASTNHPGETELLRVQDVDHNGRPDIVVINEEGPWPSEKNKLRLFREKQEPTSPRVRLSFPRGHEKFIRGAVVFIEWTGAVPPNGGGASTITLKLSTDGPAGPFTDIAVDVPNAGRYQWRIPPGLPFSRDCCIRVVLNAPGASHQFTMQQPFSLL